MPPEKNMVNEKSNIIQRRPGKVFMDSGYAHSVVTTILMAVPTII